MYSKRGAIALLITILFIMAITVSIGIALKYVNKASESVESETFSLQTSIILDDVLALLQKSKELEQIKSAESLYMFLSQAAFIPLESSGIKVLLELKSARANINVNSFYNKPKRVDMLKMYMNNYMVNTEYVDILLDVMGGIKEDMSYNSDIFYEKPTLFRDYIVSHKHLKEINDFFTLSYRENSLKNINFDNLFYFSKDKESSVDLNYATADVWELMLGCDKQRAQDLFAGGGSYLKAEDLQLDDSEKLELAKFNTSYYQPYIDVTVEVLQNDNRALIRFEYDILKKEGYGFVYEL